jgi:hypothetical protein
MEKKLKSEDQIPKHSQDQAFADANQQEISNSEHASVNVKDVVLFIKQLCLTYAKFSLYPPDHPVTQSQIKTAWNELLPIFKKYGNVDITFTDGKLLFFGLPVEERNPTVNKFARHFESFNIKGIEFSKDLTNEEFARFITVFSQDSKVIIEQGGTDLLLKQHEINNINFHAAVYQVVREDQKVVREAQAAEDKKNESIRKVNEIKPTSPNENTAKNILVKYLESDGSLQVIQELLKSIDMDPEIIKRVIQDIKRIMEETGLDAEELIRYLEHQINNERDSLEENDKKPKGKKRKKISKKFRPLADRIRNKLKTDFKDIKGKDKLIEYLDNIYAREITRVVESKTAELQDQIESDKKTFFEIGEALEQTDIGVIVLNDDSKISFMEHAESLPIPLSLGDKLPPELIALIKTTRKERQWKVEETRVGQIRFILFKV